MRNECTIRAYLEVQYAIGDCNLCWPIRVPADGRCCAFDGVRVTEHCKAFRTRWLTGMINLISTWSQQSNNMRWKHVQSDVEPYTLDAIRTIAGDTAHNL